MIAWNKSNAFPVNRQKSALEEDVWLMPAGSVDVEPPEFNLETQTCSWDGSEWIVADIPISEPYVEIYADKRLKEYGSLQEQIEYITENGLDAWQTRVSSIKAKYPKPSE